jgi:hypothetical protein
MMMAVCDYCRKPIHGKGLEIRIVDKMVAFTIPTEGYDLHFKCGSDWAQVNDPE